MSVVSNSKENQKGGFIREKFRDIGRLRMQRDEHAANLGEQQGERIANWAAKTLNDYKKFIMV